MAVREPYTSAFQLGFQSSGKQVDSFFCKACDKVALPENEDLFFVLPPVHEVIDGNILICWAVTYRLCC